MSFKRTGAVNVDEVAIVHLSVRIYETSSGKYVADAVFNGEWNRFDINLSPKDVSRINSRLQHAIQRIAALVDQEDFNDLPEYDNALYELANEGKAALNKIIPQNYQSIIAQSLQNGAVIQMLTDTFILPWELLYDGTLNAVDPLNFWGMKYIICRPMISVEQGELPFVPRTARPKVGLVLDDNLEYAVSHELPLFRKLDDEKRVVLSILPELDISRQNDHLDKFGRFLGADMDIFHAACHAVAAGASDEDGYLRVSSSFYIRMTDFDSRSYKIKYHPFVVLNACRTGTADPRHTSNWAAYFWKSGARGVLATEFQVPDWFAADFSERLYYYILEGLSIGQSLFLARHHFWKKFKNPIGLAYALYSSSSIRIVSIEEVAS